MANYPEEIDFVNTSDNNGEIRVREQGFEKWKRWSSSTSEESRKETYLSQLLNARSLNPKPSKLYIQECVEDDRLTRV